MSFYSDASLVLIPSGYKDQKIYSAKPTDGLGDLVFSRASDATRVASNGLIEKVRTNTILHSQAFDNAAYNKGVGGSVVANTVVAPDGTMTADAYTWATATATYAYLTQSVAGTSQIPNTFSIYLKRPAGSGSRTVRLAVTDLTISTTFGPNLTVTESWQRFELSRTSASTTGNVGVGLMTGSTGVSIAAGDILEVWGAQLETGDIATDYIPTTTAAVSVGPVSGLPRLDYLGSTCPRLLLEPQRTNLLTFSESFGSAGNLEQAVVTSNTIVSPDGSVNADSFIDNTANNIHAKISGIGKAASPVTYTYSLFIKAKDAGMKFQVSMDDAVLGGGSSGVFDPSTGTFVTAMDTPSAGYTNPSRSVTNYGNGWYRISFTITTASATTNRFNAFVVNAANAISYIGTGTGIYVYGAQAEVGAYATSYIPTLGTSVTRVADAASKTGISALIGSTAGTVFIDATLNTGTTQNADIFLLKGAGTGALVMFLAAASGNINLYLNTTGVVRTIKSGNNRGQRVKVAISYQSGSLVAYINGVQTLSTGYTIEPDLADLYINTNNVGTNKENTILSQFLLFKTRLTNAQLAELTTL
jgi:hypothetical protein